MRPGIAAFAGAWVLWGTMASMVGTELKHTWQVEAVYATRDPCERAVNAYLVAWKQQGLEVTANGVAIARQRLGEAEALLLRSHKCRTLAERSKDARRRHEAGVIGDDHRPRLALAPRPWVPCVVRHDG